MIKIFLDIVSNRFFLLTACLLSLSLFTHAQDTNPNLLPPTNKQDTIRNNTNQHLTLQQCIAYALLHQPGFNQSLINVDIAKATRAINLSGWLPQVSVTGNLIHYNQLGSMPNSTSTGGFPTNSQPHYSNTFNPQFAASQALFSPTLLYAAQSAPTYIKQAEELTVNTKINLVSMVSKSFYGVLVTLKQIDVLKEDTARLGQNLRNAYHQYKGGIVDETDYEQASITLNNSIAQLKQATENMVPQYATLKQLMGYPIEKELNVSFDTLQMIKNIHMDTTQQLQYEKRIEYQQIKTQKNLQYQLTHYYKLAFIPTLSAFYNHNLGFQSNQFANLFDSSSPTSLIGLSINIPIFAGLSRLHNVHKAQLQEKLIEWDEINLKSQINSEYKTALANYKSNLYNFELLQKNVALAKRVYFVVDLQYKQGIVAYLNVITAESNLITSQLNYLNALFQLLSSKIDLEKAMGTISF
jgi:outer membrane protein TolC